MKSVNLSDDELLDNAERIISTARAKGIPLKLVGGLAIYAQISRSREHGDFFRKMDRMLNRNSFADVDFVSSSKKHKDVKHFFENDLSFKGDMYVNTVYATQRNIFYHPGNLFDVDIFYDRMQFSHLIEFAGREGIDGQSADTSTLPPADLLLTKLQIHNTERKDFVDIAALLLGNGIAAGDSAIDTDRLTGVLQDDWGFWYDAMNNLRKTVEFVRNECASGRISESEASLISDRAGRLTSLLDSCEKSRKWQKRCKKGTKKIWYNEIEEVER